MKTMTKIVVKGFVVDDEDCFVLSVGQMPRTPADYLDIKEKVVWQVGKADISFVIDDPDGMVMPVLTLRDHKPRLELLDVSMPWVALMRGG